MSARDLLANATSRPWTFRFVPGSERTPSGWHLSADSLETLADLGDDDSAQRDAALIVAAVNQFEALLKIEYEARRIREHWPAGTLMLGMALARLDALREAAAS